MSRATDLRLSVNACGCLREQPQMSEIFWFRCASHFDRMVRLRAILPVRRCESCRRRVAVVRVWFPDGSDWRVCRWCEPGSVDRGF